MLKRIEGDCKISLFRFFDIYIYKIIVIMKPEYKEKALSYIDGINNRARTIKEMMEGKRPANQEQAIRLAIEIERLLEQTQTIVELS